MNYTEKIMHRKGWIDLLEQNETKYVVTVTLKREVSERYSEETVKSLLKRIRKDYFGRNSQRQFLDGYIVTEKKKSEGHLHYHILFKDNLMLQRPDRYFPDVVMKKCENLKLIDETRGVDIQKYYHRNVEKYLTKSIEYDENNFEFIKPLTYDGF